MTWPGISREKNCVRRLGVQAEFAVIVSIRDRFGAGKRLGIIIFPRRHANPNQVVIAGRGRGWAHGPCDRYEDRRLITVQTVLGEA